MKMIVNVDQNWGIGLKNQLLIRIPADLKFFREHTENHVVVCGRHTLESFPGQVPLPNRTTIVLSRNPKYNVRHAIMARSVEDLIGILKEEGYDLDDVYIIGGQKVYQDLLPYCDTAYVTKVDYEYEADAYFPNLDNDEDWECTEVSEEQTYYDIIYHFTTYTRKNPVEM
ncbi:MAG: dihydrofolate reductase [Lachnospiraceae bacterium]|nr:dihydrofolate reductase [Lachnospiraceae bacterium]MDD6147935.1 dihydrofolate reductase [Lachnospiraceae bacterium]MDY5704597.1 dihydrofolate reductase [Lachnospiraceae bacterium]